MNINDLINSGDEIISERANRVNNLIEQHSNGSLSDAEFKDLLSDATTIASIETTALDIKRQTAISEALEWILKYGSSIVKVL
jgi:hypothetical protein